MSPAAVRVLVVAKAPVAGEAKTRLAATIGNEQAADVAAAALLDTLLTVSAYTVCATAHVTPVLALTGDLSLASRGAEIEKAIREWQVVPQRGDGFAERLACAHADAGVFGPEPVLQIGMDTPQISVAHLHDMACALAAAGAVLGPAEDGGWWLLGLHDPTHAQLLRDVPMSASDTGTATLRALESAGLQITIGAPLRDVDELTDAEAVALMCPEGSRFATTWAAIRR